jgi:hypothetical protein
MMYLQVSLMRPVVLSVLEHLPQVETTYLNEILNDKDLFNDVAMSVKQQIWEGMYVQRNEAIFIHSGYNDGGGITVAADNDDDDDDVIVMMMMTMMMRMMWFLLYHY